MLKFSSEHKPGAFIVTCHTFNIQPSQSWCKDIIFIYKKIPPRVINDKWLISDQERVVMKEGYWNSSWESYKICHWGTYANGLWEETVKILKKVLTVVFRSCFLSPSPGNRSNLWPQRGVCDPAWIVIHLWNFFGTCQTRLLIFFPFVHRLTNVIPNLPTLLFPTASSGWSQTVKPANKWQAKTTQPWRNKMQET